LNELSQDSLIAQIDSSVYFVQSEVLARSLGSGLCGFRNFYIGISDDVAAIARRKGLVQKLNFDHAQHRTIIYKPYYQQMKATFPDKVSGLLVTGPEFGAYLQPLVSGPPYINQIFSAFKYTALTVRKNSEEGQLSVNFSS